MLSPLANPISNIQAIAPVAPATPALDVEDPTQKVQEAPSSNDASSFGKSLREEPEGLQAAVQAALSLNDAEAQEVAAAEASEAVAPEAAASNAAAPENAATTLAETGTPQGPAPAGETIAATVSETSNATANLDASGRTTRAAEAGYAESARAQTNGAPSQTQLFL